MTAAIPIIGYHNPNASEWLTTTSEVTTKLNDSSRINTTAWLSKPIVPRNFTNDTPIVIEDPWAAFDNMYPLELVIPFTIVYAVIFLTGVVGNISTCIVIARNKSMHTATNYYLFSLAVSDMLLLISGLPPEMYRIWSPDQYIFGQLICILQGFSAETSANATVLTISAFTVERYLAICHPFLSHTMSRLSRAIRIIISIWVVALTLAVPQAVQFGIEVDQQGDVVKSHCTVVTKIFDHAFEISTIVFFVAPMTMITVLYVLIGRQLKKSTAKRPSLTQHNSAAVGGGYSQAANGDAAKKRLRHTQAQNRVVKMLIAVVAAFFICWAPFHAQRLLAVYLSTASTAAQVTFWQLYIYLVYISGMLYYVSTCINPLLYHIMSNKYRNAFKKTFHNVLHPNRRNHTTGLFTPTHGVKLIRKKGDFLGERPPTCENKHSSHSSRLTPQTSETSFSSSKLENSHALLNKKNPKIFINERKRSSNCSSSLKNRFLRFFKTGVFFGQGYVPRSQSISNSSLKDTDELGMNASDLVDHMKQVNELL